MPHHSWVTTSSVLFTTNGPTMLEHFTWRLLQLPTSASAARPYRGRRRQWWNRAQRALWPRPAAPAQRTTRGSESVEILGSTVLLFCSFSNSLSLASYLLGTCWCRLVHYCLHTRCRWNWKTRISDSPKRRAMWRSRAVPAPTPPLFACPISFVSYCFSSFWRHLEWNWTNFTPIFAVTKCWSSPCRTQTAACPARSTHSSWAAARATLHHHSQIAPDRSISCSDKHVPM